jgi:competence protein ComEC
MTRVDRSLLPLPKPGWLWQSCVQRIAQAASDENGRLLVWSPLLLVLGIWTYFSLQMEPANFVGALFAAIAVCALWPPFQISAPIRVVAVVALGFGLGQLRSQWVATPLLRAYAPAQTIEGLVAEVDQRSRQRFVLLLDVQAAKGLPEADVPRRLLLTITGKHTAPLVGQRVEAIADLTPLPRPAQPGAFDYGRQLYFRSIGGLGRTKLAPRVLDGAVPLAYQMRHSLHNLRTAIGARVRAAIPGPLGSFADALITGERASIPRAMNDSLQSSGLFHVLSISGLHMALVAGGAFWVVRALLALSSHLALNYPIKKWAAMAALAVGLLYMLLADSGPATERSFIMIAVVFLAVMVDRPALSLRNLALAAVLILVFQPEQALAASFQMSFMAVMGLAALYGLWSRWQDKQPPAIMKSRGRRWARKAFHFVALSLATSLVAGVLSGVPAAHHFGRLAPYGVLANALALPFVSLLVMPAAMVGVVMMPLGLDGPAFQVMSMGLEGVCRC